MSRLTFLTLFLVVMGCSEDLVTEYPQGTLFSSEYFNNAQELEQSLISTYDVLGHQKGIDLAWAPPLIISEALSDDAVAGGQDPGDGALLDEFNTFRFSTTNQMVHSLWKKNYFGIGRANFTIEKAQNLLKGDDASTIQTYVAEAKFLRAYFYFELVKFFENVPLITSLPPTIKAAAALPQAKPLDVYNQIATDLVAAISNLPETRGSARASKWAAQALLARVYLFYDGFYSGSLDAEGVTVDGAYVLTQLEDLILNSGHDLINNYDSIFTKENEFGVESIFEIAYEPFPINGDWGAEHYIEGNLAAQMMGPRVSGSKKYYRGWAFGIMTQKLFREMQGDPRLDATILTQATILSESGTSLNTGSYQHTGYYNNKYTTRLIDLGDQGGTAELHNTINQRVIRFSDVLLMAAELGQNATHLNRVRARVGLGEVAYSEDALFNERRMELAGEGLRYFDLMRRGASFMQNELNVSNDIGPEYTGTPESIYDVDFSSAPSPFLPIPQVEIDLSGKTLIQNKGY